MQSLKQKIKCKFGFHNWVYYMDNQIKTCYKCNKIKRCRSKK